MNNNYYFQGSYIICSYNMRLNCYNVTKDNIIYFNIRANKYYYLNKIILYILYMYIRIRLYQTTNTSSNQRIKGGSGGTKKSKTLTWYWVAVPLILRDQHAKPGLSGGALRATLSESSSLPSCTVRGGPTPPPFFLKRRGWMCTRRRRYIYHNIMYIYIYTAVYYQPLLPASGA